MVESEEFVEQNLSELERNAVDRRQRLIQLRARIAGENQKSNDDDAEERPPGVLLLRSYKPVASNEPLPTLGSTKEDINLLENKIAGQLEASKEIKVGDSLDLKTLAPRKVDWDLRRGITDKLEKLDRRTNKAITELIRKRMKEEGKGEESELLAAAIGDV